MKLQMGIFLASMLILSACNKNSTSNESTPTPAQAPQAQSNDNMSDKNTASSSENENTNTSQKSIILNEGSKLEYSEESANAFLQPKEIKFKIKMAFYSANWGFLPNPDNLQESCDAIKESVERAINNGQSVKNSVYSDILDMEASYFSLEQNSKSEMEMANQFLSEKGLKKFVVLKKLKMSEAHIKEPSLRSAGKTLSRDLNALVNALSNAQKGKTNISLTIGELCDLTDKNNFIMDETKFTKMTFVY